MVRELDPRLVQVGIQIGASIEYYDDLYITATGTKYGNANANECQVRIDNLTKAHRDAILTETSPFASPNSTLQKKLIVRAGRKSYGLSTLFVGTITTSAITQPPDIGIILNALTGFDTSCETISVSMPGQASLKTISQAASKALGTSLNFQATDKNIANYSFTGSAQNHVDNLGKTGGVDAFVDNETLVLKDKNVPLQTIRKVSQSTGMIGIPEVTAEGVRVKFLLDNDTELMGQLQLESVLNPSLNGTYEIFKLGFDIASRDTPFYWIADCGRIG